MYRRAQINGFEPQPQSSGARLQPLVSYSRTGVAKENVMSTVASFLSRLALIGPAPLSLLHLLSRRRPGIARSGDGVYCCAETINIAPHQDLTS
ncbi:hypothetical protein IMCC3135_27750 [Granulosicoccus antarcticus IMCC3135]|uniref:Uncharacterized protein n=1 Tax=Granulosicoccus antarcticus IMCC3135 TaxID=1192854 RepID=A0A2Z2NWJ2_9GAMM|nr:hypothetical protein IMCC3135_27750 [Granulosicoccus antarcticus IMCC3135]